MDYVTTSKEKWVVLKPLAKENRKNMTHCERITWELIRNNQLGVKFRRQQIIADYIVDFVSLEIKLIIEIDGPSHLEQEDFDANRTKLLNDMGYKVIRFTNEEVRSDISFIEKIKKEIDFLKNPT